jgi:hypothetical protein
MSHMSHMSDKKNQHQNQKYIPLGDAAAAATLNAANKIARVEIEHQPGQERSQGAYTVPTYDQHNTLLNQQAFRYSHRSDKRSAMNRAISLADKEALPNKLRTNRVNF